MDQSVENKGQGHTLGISNFGIEVKCSLDAWRASIAELARWIRYTPPPADAKQIEPPFEEHGDEDDKGGPETIH